MENLSSTVPQNLEIPSSANSCQFPAHIYLPRSCDAAAASVAVILHGRGRVDEPFSHESLLIRYPYTESLQLAADITHTAICIPFLGSFAHLDSPVLPHIRHATFIGTELPDYLVANHGLKHQRIHWSLLGFSMGGTATINILARYPEMYSIASNFGGNCDPAFYPKILKRAAPAENVLGPYDQFPERFHEWSNDHALDLLSGRKDVAISLGCGREDPRLGSIRQVRDRVASMDIAYTYTDYPGEHIYEFSHLLMQLAAVKPLRKFIAPDL